MYVGFGEGWRVECSSFVNVEGSLGFYFGEGGTVV